MPALYRVGVIVVIMALLASLTHYGMGSSRVSSACAWSSSGCSSRST